MAMPRPAVRKSAAPSDGSGAQFIWQFAAVEAHAQRGGDSVVGVAAKVIVQVVARVVSRGRVTRPHVGVPEMTVGVDERRYDGLALKIDDCGACWPANRASGPDLGDA